jgi:hypothetical protein
MRHGMGRLELLWKFYCGGLDKKALLFEKRSKNFCPLAAG